MKKIVVLCATAALLIGCGDSDSGRTSVRGKNSANCVPNANLSAQSVSVEKAEGSQSQKVTVPAQGTLSETSETVVTLLNGKKAKTQSNEPENDPEASPMVIDFAKKTITLEGQVVSFERDAKLSAEKGRDIFVAVEAQTKAALLAATNADPEVGLKICSVNKAKMQFSYDPAKKTIDLEEAYDMSVKLDDEFAAAIQDGEADESEDKSKIVVEKKSL